MVKDKLSTYVSNVDHDLFLEANDFVLGMNSLTSYKFGDGVLFDKTQITINEPKSKRLACWLWNMIQTALYQSQ